MKNGEFQKLAVRVARLIATKRGFEENSDGKYFKVAGVVKLVFWFDAVVKMRVGDLTLNVGVDVPALSALIARVPGPETESGRWPCFGGPIFRFGDLSKRKLHDFIVEVCDGDSDQEVMARIDNIWEEFAEAFFTRMTASDEWFSAVDDYLSQRRFDPFLFSPIHGRICIALMHVSSDSDAAPNALMRLQSRGSRGRPVQDYGEALELHRQITADPDLIRGLQEQVFMSRRK